MFAEFQIFAVDKMIHPFNLYEYVFRQTNYFWLGSHFFNAVYVCLLNDWNALSPVLCCTWNVCCYSNCDCMLWLFLRLTTSQYIFLFFSLFLPLYHRKGDLGVRWWKMGAVGVLPRVLSLLGFYLCVSVTVTLTLNPDDPNVCSHWERSVPLLPLLEPPIFYWLLGNNTTHHGGAIL